VNPEPGGEAAARGGSAYRDGPTEGPVLRAGRERMLVSTEPLDKRYLRQANVHRLFVGFFALAFTLAGLALGPTLVTDLFGTVGEARIVDARHWTTKSKSTVNHHYAATVRYRTSKGTDVDLTYDVPVEIYYGWAEKRFDRVAVIIAFDSQTFSNLGSRARLDGGTGVFGLICTAIVLAFYVYMLRNAREWYDKRRVVTTGTGPIVL